MKAVRLLCRPAFFVGDRSVTLISRLGTFSLLRGGRSRVSFFMNKFRKLGFISYNGKIEVHNSLLNAVLHDTPQLRMDQAEGGHVVDFIRCLQEYRKQTERTECRSFE